MKHLVVDCGTILSKAGLPPVILKEGDSMMSMISAFERNYVEVGNSDLNLRTHMFRGSAVAIVMEAFRKYYHVEQSAISMQGNEKDIQEVSSKNSSPLQKLGSPPNLAEPTSCRETSKMTQVYTLPTVDTSTSMSMLKNLKRQPARRIVQERNVHQE